MRVYDIIYNKRQGIELTKDEIQYIVNGFTEGRIPDYQVSALLMAIFFKKLNKKETVELTKAMMNSGDILDLSEIKGAVLDKHSTGGVGDTTTLVLAPLVASCGIKVAKMSGRGLGHTGGTIDKLESIPGFSTDISKDDFINQVNKIGIAIAGQTARLAPADKKIYALRDVTATVDDLSLIASSIMSKKLASGAQGILLDVKTGDGAFMKEINDSFSLAQLMIDIGTSMGKNTSAIISDMNQPLGRAVGNAMEVKEAIDILKGKGPEDLYNLCLTLGVELMLMAGITNSSKEAMEMLKKNIDNGRALNKLKELITAQGGDPDVIDNTNILPLSSYKIELKSEKKQYIRGINTEEIGMCALLLGAGREVKDSKIDLSVGIYLNKKIGDLIYENDVIGEIHCNSMKKGNKVLEKLKGCFYYSDNPVSKPKLIYGIINKEGKKVF